MHTADLRCDIDRVDDCLVVRPVGTLGTATYPDLRDVLLKCLVDQPRAVVADLGGLTIAGDSVLSVFPAVWLRTCDWPGVPLLLATGPVHGGLVRHPVLRRYVPVYSDVPTALSHVDDPPQRRRAHLVLPHSPAGPRVARQFVRRTCADWLLPRATAGNAVQVAAELVQNTVQHTLSEARLRLELRTGMLTVAVADDDPTPVVVGEPGPEPGVGGRGMLLVVQSARTWGCVPDHTAGRKVVWAVLPAHQRR